MQKERARSILTISMQENGLNCPVKSKIKTKIEVIPNSKIRSIVTAYFHCIKSKID